MLTPSRVSVLMHRNLWQHIAELVRTVTFPVCQRRVGLLLPELSAPHQLFFPLQVLGLADGIHLPSTWRHSGITFQPSFADPR